VVSAAVHLFSLIPGKILTLLVGDFHEARINLLFNPIDSEAIWTLNNDSKWVIFVGFLVAVSVRIQTSEEMNKTPNSVVYTDGT
jgi:hypothetical protein